MNKDIENILKHNDIIELFNELDNNMLYYGIYEDFEIETVIDGIYRYNTIHVFENKDQCLNKYKNDIEYLEEMIMVETTNNCFLMDK